MDEAIAAVTVYIEKGRGNETLTYACDEYETPTIFEAMERYICEGRVTVVLGTHYSDADIPTTDLLYWYDERMRDLGYPVSEGDEHSDCPWEEYRNDVRDCTQKRNPRLYKHRLWLERNGKPKE